MARGIEKKKRLTQPHPKQEGEVSSCGEDNPVCKMEKTGIGVDQAEAYSYKTPDRTCDQPVDENLCDHYRTSPPM